MFQISRRILNPRNSAIICSRSMGKMDQFKWKPHNKKPNNKPKLSIVLKEPVERLGNRGQLVQVERGYARNFLIPQAKAVYATKENMGKHLISFEEAAKTDPEAHISPRFLQFLKRLHLRIERKEGTSVTEHNISQEYRRQHQLVVPTHCIELLEPLTTFGDYTINVSVREGVVIPMKVTLEAWQPRIANRWKNVLSTAEQAELQGN